jgi:hypothetical protein
MNFHTTKKALTMVHPVDEQEEVNPIAVPPESQMEDYLLYLTRDEENGDNGAGCEGESHRYNGCELVLSHHHQQILCDE